MSKQSPILSIKYSNSLSINSPLQNTGFTLIEIMVVVVIIGILASVVVLNVTPNIGKGANAKIKNDLLTIENALDLYKSRHFSYPSTDQGLQSLVEKPNEIITSSNWQKDLKRLPRDPWEKPYIYVYPGQHGEVDIFTYGADGAPGGEGDNRDIGNWDL